uniref:Polycystin cation channel PKD1/PKD2 domain-containing protein n=1 Tax=Tetraselmis chuii TaxID=63592 RepID=A0A6U1JJ04_9CHLO|mmetsp:Transcript_38054/g.68255  ORF Transcript_38054/g.68255 Transcript_38054/m.68255 type:complete len:1359 (+) Transcript_38054:1-4077(+)
MQFGQSSVSIGAIEALPNSADEALLRLELLLPSNVQLNLAPEYVAQFIVGTGDGSSATRRLTQVGQIDVVGSSFTPATVVDEFAGQLATLISGLATLPDALDAAADSLAATVDATTAWLATDGRDETALSSATAKWLEDASSATATLEGNLTAVSAAADALLEMQIANNAAASSSIAALEEGIADAEALLRSLANTQEFLDSVQGISSADDSTPQPCLATSSPLVGTYAISFDAESDDNADTASRRRQLLVTSGSSWEPFDSASMSPIVFEFLGYRIESGTRSLVDLTGAPELARYLGPSKGGNRVIGGFLLHQTRRGADPSACDIHFDHLSVACAENRFLESALAEQNSSVLAGYVKDIANPLLPYGADPVFIRGLELYNPALQGQEARFYNTTPGSPDLNINDAPVLFSPRSVPGTPAGFPVVMPPELDASRAAMLVAALEQGNFFDSRTSSLTLRVAAFNPKLRLLSYATAQFTWNADGSISFSASVPETVPAYTPSLGDIGTLVALAVLVASLVLISHLPLLLWDTVARLFESSAPVEKTPSTKEAWEEGNVAPAKPSRLREGWSAGPLLDALVLGFLAFGGLASLSGLLMQMQLDGLSTSYPIYDDITTAPAAFFEPAKMEAVAGSSVEILPSTETVNRWILPDNETGLEAYGGALESIGSVSAVLTMATAAHGVALLLSIIRLLHAWSFQPRVGVITLTLRTVVPDVAHLLLLALVLVVLFGSAAHLIVGDVYGQLSTPWGAIEFVLYFLLTGDMGDLRAAIEPPAMMRNGVTLLVGRLLYMLIPFILGYVVLSFVLAIVGEGYYHAKDQLTRSSPHGELPNMLVEAAALMRYRKGLRGSRHWKKLPLRAGARAKLTTEEREEKVKERDEEVQMDALKLLEHWCANGPAADPIDAFRAPPPTPLEAVTALLAEMEEQLKFVGRETEYVEEMMLDVTYHVEHTAALSSIAARKSMLVRDSAGDDTIQSRVEKQATRQQLREDTMRMRSLGGKSSRNMGYTAGVVLDNPSERSGSKRQMQSDAYLTDLPGTPDESARRSQPSKTGASLRSHGTWNKPRDSRSPFASQDGEDEMKMRASWRPNTGVLEGQFDVAPAADLPADVLPDGARARHTPEASPPRTPEIGNLFAEPPGMRGRVPGSAPAQTQSLIVSGAEEMTGKKKNSKAAARDSSRLARASVAGGEEASHRSKTSDMVSDFFGPDDAIGGIPAPGDDPSVSSRTRQSERGSYHGGSSEARLLASPPGAPAGAGYFLQPRGRGRSTAASARKGPTGGAQRHQHHYHSTGGAFGNNDSDDVFTTTASNWGNWATPAPSDPNVRVSTTTVAVPPGTTGGAERRPRGVMGQLANFFRPGTAM